jgi:biotin operon repressor
MIEKKRAGRPSELPKLFLRFLKKNGDGHYSLPELELKLDKSKTGLMSAIKKLESESMVIVTRDNKFANYYKLLRKGRELIAK